MRQNKRTGASRFSFFQKKIKKRYQEQLSRQKYMSPMCPTLYCEIDENTENALL